jgi:flagellar protein FlaG
VATVSPSPPAVVSTSTSAPPIAGHPALNAGAVSTTISQTPSAPPSAHAVEAAAQQIDEYLKSHGRSLEFRVDHATGRSVVTVTDAATGKPIRQIPSEETLRLAQILDTQPHFLIDLLA